MQTPAADDLASVPDAFRILFMNFHPIHVESVCLTLEIFGGQYGLIWMSDAYTEYVLDAFGSYKHDHNFKYRFEPILMTLNSSENLIVVLTVLGFLRNLLASFSDYQKRNLAKSEID